MANALASLFGEIADVIREKTGETETMTPSEFPAKIDGIKVGGAGGSLPAGVYFEADSIFAPNKYYQTRFVLGGNVYVMYTPYSGAGPEKIIVKYVDGSWVEVVPQTTMKSDVSNCIKYNGKIYFYGNGYLYTFDGSSLTRMNDTPSIIYANSMAVFEDMLYAYSYENGNLYVYDNNLDSWTLENKIGSTYNYYYPYVLNGELWFRDGRKMYKYNFETLEEKTTFSSYPHTATAYNDCLYFVDGNEIFFKYDPSTNVTTKIGYAAGVASNGINSELWNDGNAIRYTDNKSKDATSGIMEFIVHIIEETPKG